MLQLTNGTNELIKAENSVDPQYFLSYFVGLLRCFLYATTYSERRPDYQTNHKVIREMKVNPFTS